MDPTFSQCVAEHTQNDIVELQKVKQKGPVGQSLHNYKY